MTNYCGTCRTHSQRANWKALLSPSGSCARTKRSSWGCGQPTTATTAAISPMSWRCRGRWNWPCPSSTLRRATVCLSTSNSSFLPSSCWSSSSASFWCWPGPGETGSWTATMTRRLKWRLASSRWIWRLWTIGVKGSTVSDTWRTWRRGVVTALAPAGKASTCHDNHSM